MQKIIVIVLSLLFASSPKEKRYIIVVGDISCKACVIQLHNYLHKRVKKENLSVAFRDKGYFVLNESSINYYKSELQKARFVFLKQLSFFPAKEKFPYLLRVLNNDTVKIPYDSLFIGESLNLKYLN